MKPTSEDALFAEALSRPVHERASFLDGACRGDLLLRQRLEARLSASDPTGSLWSPSRLPSDVEALLPATTSDFAETPDESVGQTLGRYKLLEKIGEGGCGVVYVAEQTAPVRRRVALKVIKLGMDTRQVVARFEAERQALAMMDHPNIAKVFDAGTTEKGRPYFVMELVRGIRITDYCDQAHLSTKNRLDLFMKVCHAIQHAHQKGIIHRDVKPSNILVTLHDGVPVPKVIDFGIAKATEGRLTDATVYTQLHQFIGTPAYMSPEQAEMSGLDIDTRSDIYSLGVLLYELLAGSTPFDAEELMASGLDAMRKTIREREPVRPSTRFAALKGAELTTTAKRRSVDTAKLLHQLKGDLDWIVMKCLEKDRTRRYETASGLAADLHRHLSDEPVAARPPSAAYRFQKAFRRNRLAFTAATAVAAALVAGIGVSTYQTFVARDAQREEETARNGEVAQRLLAQSAQKVAEAERERANAQAQAASESREHSRRLLYTADMALAQQSISLNNLGKARRLLERHRPQPGEEDLRGWEWRYLWQLSRSSALFTLTSRPETRGWSVSFSPDGTRLAAGWLDGRVDLWDVPGRRLIRSLTDREQHHQGQVAFSPVSNLLAATSEPRTVALHDLDSGQESVGWRASDQADWRVRGLAFSPDGSKLIVYARSGDGDLGDEISLVNVSSSRIENRFRTESGGSLYGFLGAARLSPDNRRLYLTRRLSIQCLDVASGQELWQSEPERKAFGMTSLALSPDGRVLASCSGYEDPAIRIRDAATGRLLNWLPGHTSWVCQLVYSQDGRHLISAATDQTIRFWETSTWTETKVLRGHTDEVHAVAISEAAQLVASASKDGNLTLWREDGKSRTDGYRRLPAELGSDQLLPLDRARVLLLPPGKPPELLDLQRDSPLGSLPKIGSSSEVLGWFGSNILCHWNGANQILVHELRGAEFIPLGAVTLNAAIRPTGFAYNAARQLLAWSEASSPASIYLEGLAEPSRRIELKGDVPGARPFRFSEDGNYLVAKGKETLRAWNVETGRIVASVEGRIGDPYFAAGGRVLVAIIQEGDNYQIAFHDLALPGQAPRRVPGQFRGAAMAVSPDGALVAATDKGQVRLFDPVKGESIDPPLHGHLNPVYSLAFSPDGRRLISASGGRESARLWDVSTRQELLTLTGTGSMLNASRWSADGDVILASDPWQAWRAPSWEEIAAAEAKDKLEARRP